jgi:hypothetical protein
MGHSGFKRGFMGATVALALPLAALVASPVSAATGPCNGKPMQIYFSTDPVDPGESTFVSPTAACTSTYVQTWYGVPGNPNYWVYAGSSNAYGLFTTPAGQEYYNGEWGVWWYAYACDASGCSQGASKFMRVRTTPLNRALDGVTARVGNCDPDGVDNGVTYDCYEGKSSNGIAVWYNRQRNASVVQEQAMLDAIGARYKNDQGINGMKGGYFYIQVNGVGACPTSGGCAAHWSDTLWINTQSWYTYDNVFGITGSEIVHETFDRQAAIRDGQGGTPSDGSTHCRPGGTPNAGGCYPMSDYLVGVKGSGGSQ